MTNRDISNELRSTISTLAVMQSCATDPGHVLTMTGSLLNWTHAGLVAKYDYELNGLDPKFIILMEKYELTDLGELINSNGEPIQPENLNYMWDSAIDYYNTSRQYWGTSVKICRRIADQLIAIGVREDMFDYKIMATNFMDEMKAMKAMREEDQDNTKGGKDNGRVR